MRGGLPPPPLLADKRVKYHPLYQISHKCSTVLDRVFVINLSFMAGDSEKRQLFSYYNIIYKIQFRRATQAGLSLLLYLFPVYGLFAIGWVYQEIALSAAVTNQIFATFVFYNLYRLKRGLSFSISIGREN